MANQKEKTVEELLEKTKKLTECRPSCVLEGKASMRGPGVNDPSDEVCDTCGSQVDEDDLRVCSTCDRGFHTSCLELPINASLDVDWLCSQCEGVNNCLPPASEASLNSSSGDLGQQVMACILDSKLDSQDEPSKGSILLSDSQDKSYQQSKSVASVEDGEKTLDQSERGHLDFTEGASCSGVDVRRKSDQGSVESCEQSPTLDNVRRSKRGRPYKPVRGLHPNKRRVVDSASKHTDKVAQGRSRRAIDEEDELGAKIEKFRVISSIDEKSVKKGAPYEEVEGRGLLAAAGVDVDEEKISKSRESAAGTLAFEHTGFVDNKGISGDGRNLEEDSKTAAVRGEVKLDSLCAVRGDHAVGKEGLDVEETTLKLQNDAPEGLSCGTFPPVIPQNDVGQGCESELSCPDALVESQQTLALESTGTDSAQKQLQGQTKVESSIIMPISLSDELVGSKSVSGLLVENFGINMVGMVHPASSSTRLENPGRFQMLQEMSHNVHTVNESGPSKNMCVETAKILDTSEDELRENERSTSDQGKNEVRNLVSHVEHIGMKTDFENASMTVIGVQDGIPESDCGGTETAPNVGCGLEGPGMQSGGVLLQSIDCKESPEAGSHILVTSQPSMGNIEKSISKEILFPVATSNVFNLTSDIQEGFSSIHPMVSKSDVLTPPCSSSATNPDSDYPPLQSSPTSVLHGKSQSQDIPPVVEANAGPPAVASAIQGARDSLFLSAASKDAIGNTPLNIPTTIFPELEPNKAMLGTAEPVVKGALDGSPVSNTSITSANGKFDPSFVGAIEPVGKPSFSSSSLPLELDGVVSTPGKALDIPAVMNEDAAVSLRSDNIVEVNASLLISPPPAELTHRGEAGDEAVPSPLASTTAPSPLCPGRTPDDSTGMMCKGDLPGALSSNSEEEQLDLRGLQKATLEEEDDVKVCDICGDAGYEECLAVCNACNEGAEHIYCMQALLHAVPDTGWLCEGCKSKEKAGNLKQVEDVPLNHVHPGSIYLSPKKVQFIKGNTRSRLSARLDKGKGSSQRIGATKGPPTHQVSTKRPADDAGTAPYPKRQAWESIGIPYAVTSTLASRGLTRENSFKTPDSGKVKFLSPNAVANFPAGVGNRNSGKSSGFLSQSPRPGLSQLTQVASKNRYASNGSASSESAMGAASTAARHPPLTPRLPPSYVSAASSVAAGRDVGHLKSNDPSYLLPSRSAHAAASKGSKEATFEGKGTQPVGRDTSPAFQLAVGGSSGKGWTALSSGKNATKWIDTPRPVTQLPGPGRQCYPPKVDAAICSQPLDSTGMPAKSMASQKRLQTVDSTKSINNLSRLPSFRRLSNLQPSQDEAPRSSDLQELKGPRQDLKLVGSSGSGTRVASILESQPLSNKVSPADSQDLEPGGGGIQHVKGFGEISKGQSLDPPGIAVGNGQRNFFGAPHDEVFVPEDVKQPSRATRKVSPTKQLVLDETANCISKGPPLSGKDLKWKGGPEMSWPSSAPVASMRSTRCYKCKEIGHSAQTCSSRSTATTSLADLYTKANEAPGSSNSPKESLGGSSSSLWGPKSSASSSLGVQKHAGGSSADPVSASPVHEPEQEGCVPVLESPTDFQQGLSATVVSGSLEDAPRILIEDTKRRLPSPLSLSKGGTTAQVCTQSGQPAALVTSGDLQSIAGGKAKVSLDPGASLLNDAAVRKPPVPISITQARQPEGFPGGDFTALGALTEAQQSDSGTETFQEGSLRLLSKGAQASCREMNLLAGPGIPAPLIVNRPLDPPFPTPMMMQLKNLGPWGQIAPPRPVPGVDRMVNQDARGIRGGGGIGPGIGASVSHGFGSSPSAVPESYCLWSGGFEVVSAAVPAFYDGLQAFSSSCAAPKVRTVTKTLPPRLQLEEVQRMFNADAWPKQFQQRPPTDKEIALYFFPDGESVSSSGPGYMKLLEHVMARDLVLMGHVEGAEILIFPSHLLPVEYHLWKNKLFLWGVYRARKSNPAVPPAPLDAGQIFSSTLAQTSSKLVVSGQPENFVNPVIPTQKSNPAVLLTPLDSAQISASPVVQTSAKVVVSGQSENLARPGTPTQKSNPAISSTPPLDSEQISAGTFVPTSANVVVSGQPENLFRPGTPTPPVVTSNGDAGEVDMEIDMIGDREVDVPRKPTQKSRWDQPCTLTSPPLPHEPPPVQPPPPTQTDVVTLKGQQEGSPAQDCSSVEITSKECDSADSDLPPGFGPIPQKQAPKNGPPGFNGAPPGFKPALLNGPPGFEKFREGVVTVQKQVNAEDGTASTADVDNSESTSNQLPLRRENTVAEHVRPVTKSCQMSPVIAPSPSPRDLRDDSVVGTSHTSRRRHSHSSSQSPIRYRERTKDQSGGGASFHERGRDKERERERRRDKERGRDRERGKDRGRDRETHREKDKERRRERGHDRDRVKDRESQKDRSVTRDRDRHRDYRYEDRDRGRESRYRRRARSSSKSQSRSRSFSASTRRLQSPSASPTRRRSSGKGRSRRRSRSYSDSPDSSHGRPWRKPTSTERHSGSREQSNDGVGSKRRVASPIDDIVRDVKFARRGDRDVEASHKSRLSIFSGRRDIAMTEDVARKEEVSMGAEPKGSVSSIPFYDIHHEEAEAAETQLQNCRGENTYGDTVPYYHVFLPAESGDAQVFETDTGDDRAEQPYFSKTPTPGACASKLEVLTEQPQLDTPQSHGAWEQDKAVESSAYQFFPAKAGNVRDFLQESSTNPNLELVLGGKDRRNTQQPRSLPFFVHLVDPAVSSLEPGHGYIDSREPPDLTMEFPLVTDTKEEPGKVEVGSLNLTLSVPQYRKEGNVWVKIKEAETLIGDEDVDFALTL